MTSPRSSAHVRAHDWGHATRRQTALWFRNALHDWVGAGKPNKEWRVSNVVDCWRWSGSRSDPFWTSQHLGQQGSSQNPLVAGLLRFETDRQWDYQTGTDDWHNPRFSYMVPTKSYEILRAICLEDECVRDLIIGIGLVCRNLSVARELAMQFAERSEVNWPVYALRIPLAEARRLLGGRREYAQLLSNLEIREMTPGRARYEAIMKHMASFPDYTEKDMPDTSIALIPTKSWGH